MLSQKRYQNVYLAISLIVVEAYSYGELLNN